MSNRRGPHVIARPRKRADITTTEIDTNKLNELVAAVNPPTPEVSLGRATTRSVSDEALAEIMGQQTRVAPAPTAPTRLAHTKRRDVKRAASVAGGEGESFDDPTTIHTRAAGSVPIERVSGPIERAATSKETNEAANVSADEPIARGSVVELPAADDISAAVAQLASRFESAPIPTPSADSPTRPAKLAEGSDGMIPVVVRPITESVDVSLEESPSEASAVTAPRTLSRPIAPIMPIASAMRVPTIALSGLLAAVAVALAWWLVH